MRLIHLALALLALLPASIASAKMVAKPLGWTLDGTTFRSMLVYDDASNSPCRLDDSAAIAATYERHARAPSNVTGDPALSLPVGLSSNGLPLGVQLAAAPYRERTLLRVAHAIETALTPVASPKVFAGSNPV